MPIIPFSSDSLETQLWQHELSQAFRDVHPLGEYLDLDLTCVPSHFPLLVPKPFAARMEKGNPDDPLLRQVLPRPEENGPVPEGFSKDPLQEVAPSDAPGTRPGSNIVGNLTPKGLIQKYQGRALTITTGQCAVNCRYCFRRHFPYDQAQPSRRDWEAIINHVEADQSLSEVILSGGDPLVMNDRHLSELVAKLASIPHVDMLRIHTRTPVVIPSRINEAFLTWVRELDKPMTFVLHINHPNEINAELAERMQALRACGVQLLNQSVLLRGVNDAAGVLMSLSRKLFTMGVLPYYLHRFDPVAGAQHFDLAEDVGHEIIREMSGLLPGYLVPRFVQEVPGTDSKQILQPSTSRHTNQ